MLVVALIFPFARMLIFPYIDKTYDKYLDFVDNKLRKWGA